MGSAASLRHWCTVTSAPDRPPKNQAGSSKDEPAVNGASPQAAGTTTAGTAARSAGDADSAAASVDVPATKSDGLSDVPSWPAGIAQPGTVAPEVGSSVRIVPGRAA